jgi:hypothetical protein
MVGILGSLTEQAVLWSAPERNLGPGGHYDISASKSQGSRLGACHVASFKAAQALRHRLMIVVIALLRCWSRFRAVKVLAIDQILVNESEEIALVNP